VSIQRGEGEARGCEGGHDMGMDEAKDCVEWMGGVRRS